MLTKVADFIASTKIQSQVVTKLLLRSAACEVKWCDALCVDASHSMSQEKIYKNGPGFQMRSSNFIYFKITILRFSKYSTHRNSFAVICKSTNDSSLDESETKTC